MGGMSYFKTMIILDLRYIRLVLYYQIKFLIYYVIRLSIRGMSSGS